MEVFTVGLGMLLLGVPMCLAGIFTSTLRRHRWLSALFRRQGWLYGLLSGHWLRILIWTSFSLVVSFVLLLQLHVYELVEWAVLAATIPLFTVVFAFIHRRLLNAGLHADMAVTEALVFSRRICPAMLLVLHVVAMMWWSDLPQHASIEGAVAAHTPEAAGRSGSALVREALHWAGYFDGLKAYALGHLGPTDALGGVALDGPRNRKLRTPLLRLPRTVLFSDLSRRIHAGPPSATVNGGPVQGRSGCDIPRPLHLLPSACAIGCVRVAVSGARALSRKGASNHSPSDSTGGGAVRQRLLPAGDA